MRLRLVLQRAAIWADKWDVATWIKNGQLLDRTTERPADDDPAVLIAAEQIKKDGRLILENVTKAIDQWRAKTSKPEGPT